MYFLKFLFQSGIYLIKNLYKQTKKYKKDKKESMQQNRIYVGFHKNIYFISIYIFKSNIFKSKYIFKSTFKLF